MHVVFDTSLLVSAVRSQAGASYALLAGLPHPRYKFCLSVALYMEWQAVLSRPEHLPPGQSAQTARGFLRYLASIAHLQDVHYLWRPFLRDPADDMVLELAIAAQARYIVTHNLRDFDRTISMGVIAISPGDFYQRIQSGEFS
jgi:putative PIN family toxin of toxin-antitoxin system